MGFWLINSMRFPFHSKLWKWYRLAILTALDSTVVLLSVWAAYALRLESLWPRDYSLTIWYSLPVYLGAFLFSFFVNGVYRQVWRFANFRSALLIARSVALGTILATALLTFARPEPTPPRLIPLLTMLLSYVIISITRFSWRWVADLQAAGASETSKRCIIYGAGSAGDLLARQVLTNSRFPFRIVGFIDDDANKKNRVLHGRRILGTGHQLKEICQKHDVQVVILAMPSASGKVIRSAVHRCHEVGIKPLIMPDMSSALGDDIIKPRPIDVADLLRRNPKAIDYARIQSQLEDRTVLITGGGGSIGSEIARQVLRCNPRVLILLDSSEFALYKIEEELRAKTDHDTELHFVLGLANDVRFIDKIFARFKPEVVLHAAAYKHVPLIEANKPASITNNLGGTKVVAEASIRHGVKRFLLISTDKAVRPTSIMGASKRACELMIQSLYKLQPPTSKCVFCAVRFGNVLGSSGSVIPKFMQQIQSGGPVTVTHPEVMRYFMLISEAVGLVLQAATMAEGGEVFVLNMGEQVQIYSMAKDLIRLSGKEPHKDIEIIFTGLRPGEKLYEELILDGTEKHRMHDDIYITTPNSFDPAETLGSLDEILKEATAGNEDSCVRKLKSMVEWHSAPEGHIPAEYRLEAPIPIH
ncbi:MAG: hypothetical protein RIQ81_1555 [Pseudomonadota bacterium]|jgi:FlaA1/EpsC-like NDP-sugar epimerase